MRGMKTRDKFSFIRYSNCWEDSNILLKALDIKEGETGVSVASGGDNTFTLLLSNPKEIYAFDINKTQLYLMKLKMAAIERLNYGEILAFFGLKESTDRLKTFFSLKEYMDEESFNYFNQRRELIVQGIIHIGKFERYFQIFRKFVCPLFCREARLRLFCSLSLLKEQRFYYKRYIDNLRFRTIFRMFFGIKVMGSLGRDKSFYEYVEDKRDVAGDIKKRFEYGIFNSTNFDNPYLSYILRGNFTKTAIPLYLKKENLPIIRERLSRIKLIHGSFLDIPESEKLDFFNLSDIFEYMSEEDFLENVDKLKKISGNGARIAVWNMQNRRYLPKKEFTLLKEKSKSLFRANQSYFYRDFSVYKKQE